MEKTTVLEFLQRNQKDLDEALAQLEIRKEPARLYEPVRYVLESKGKRLRPQLTMAAADVFGGEPSVALQVGLAMEVFHLFTLVHDDIMDQSDSRRGRDTIHVGWDEPTAILTGDYLLGLASELLLALPSDVLRTGLERFNQTVRELCEGQIRDMAFESDYDVDLDTYLSMIDQKTSALLKTSMVLGAMTGRASSGSLARLDEIGYHMGRAFQIQDDLLDLTAESSKWGKPVGADLLAGKKAFLLLEAIRVEKTVGGHYFQTVARDGGIPATRLEEAKIRMAEMGVLDTAQKAVIFHSEQALSLTQGLPDSLGKRAIEELINKMAVRTH